MARKQVVHTASQRAPTGGWNTRDPISGMPEGDAVTLDNFFPEPSRVCLRGGSTSHATGMTGNIETLMPYYSGTTSKLFAAVGSNVYDVTTAGAVGAAAISGQSSARYTWTNFTNSSGSYLYIVNGANTPYHYNGATWANPAITGVASNTLSWVTAFKHRLWFIEKNTLSAWYLATDAIAGAATEFDLGPLFRTGGRLVAIVPWTIDAGEGVDDHLAFITSQGEVAVYKGTDPASASTWALVGIFRIGRPVGDRPVEQFGGDVVIITVDGVLPLSKALISDRAVSERISVSGKIDPTVTSAAQSYGTLNGWQLCLYPDRNALLLNVPQSATTAHQYVMNTLTGAWCRFTGWNAFCLCRLNDSLYYGGANVVYQAWTGTSDNDANIEAEAISAFSYFQRPTQIKRWTMARPIISYDIAPGLTLGVNVDYDTSAPTSTPSYAGNAGSTWDDGLWDIAIWGGGLGIRRNWQSVSGLGYAGALHIKTASKNTRLHWMSTDYVYESGGVL